MRHIVRNAEPPKILSIIFAINAAGYITAMVVEQNLELAVCARSAAGLSLHGTADNQQDKSSCNDQSAETTKQGFQEILKPIILVIVSGFEPLAYRLGASEEHLKTLKGRGFWAIPFNLKPLFNHFFTLIIF